MLAEEVDKEAVGVAESVSVSPVKGASVVAPDAAVLHNSTLQVQLVGQLHVDMM